MVNTAAWPKLLLLAALQLAAMERAVDAFSSNGLEITVDNQQEESAEAKSACPRLSAQSRSLFLELAEDPTCANTSRTDSTCYNNHCRVCWTQRTNLNKNFVCCDTLRPTVAPPSRPVVDTAPPATTVTPAPSFDPASIEDPTPTDRPDTVPPVVAPVAPAVVSTDAPTASPLVPTEAPTVPPLAPTPPTEAPEAPPVAPSPVTDAPSDTAAPLTAPPVAGPTTDAPSTATDAPSNTAAPVTAPPVAGPVSDVPVTAPPASALPTDEPWTPNDPTYPPSYAPSDEPTLSPDATAPPPTSEPTDSSLTGSSDDSQDGSGSDSSRANDQPVPDLCSGKLSPGDRDGGVRVITDTNCINGGLGCFDFVCRYCKIEDTAASSHMLTCSAFGYHFDGDKFDEDGDSGSSKDDEPPTTVSPSSDGSNAHPNGQHGDPYTSGSSTSDCFTKLSVGDHEAGVRTIPDAKCLYGGLGCFDLECRFCKIADTDKSKHMFKCKDFGFHFVGDEFQDGSGSIDETPGHVQTEKPSDSSTGSTSNSRAEEPTSQPSEEPTTEEPTTEEPTTEEPTTEEPTTEEPSTEEPTTDEPTTEEPATEEPSTEKPTTEEPTTEAPALALTPAPEPTCDSSVSEGDARVGIDMVTDASCASGGLGCFGDLCRMCKVRESSESDHLLWCSDVLAAVAASKTQPPAPTEPPVTLAVETPVPTTWAPSGPCANQVSVGDKAVGISAVSDTQCYGGGLGCFADVCRYCKLEDTEQSGHLLPCSQFAIRGGPLFHAAAAVITETSTTFATGLKNKSIQLGLVVFGLVGAVAVVAMAAFGVSRAVRRLSASTVEDAEEDEQENDEDAELATEDVEAAHSQESTRAMETAVDWSTDSSVLTTA